jgi:hypothetical protein
MNPMMAPPMPDPDAAMKQAALEQALGGAGGAPGTVTCGVCGSSIDPVSGAPAGGAPPMGAPPMGTPPMGGMI